MERNDNFRALAENANDGILIATGEGKHVYANRRASTITGFSVEELLEIRMQDLAHPDELKKLERILRKRLGGKPVPSRYETAILRKDGKKAPVEVTGAKSSWHGQVADIVIIRDIEDRKRDQERLRESEWKYKKLMKNICDGVYILDSEGRFTFVNDVIVKRSKRTPEWFLDRSYLDVIRPEDRNRVKENFEAVMREEEVFAYELAYPTASGDELWVEVNTTSLRDGTGIIGLLGISRDISDRKLAEECLERAHEELEDRVKEKTAELKNRTQELEETNTALKVLLKRRDEDRTELEEKVVANVTELVEPYVAKLKHGRLDGRQTACVEIIESNLRDIISPLARTLSSKIYSLTPREIRVAELVKGEKITKEIAELMSISIKTVEYHRDNIRKKLGIKNEKINLRSHLLSLK